MSGEEDFGLEGSFLDVDSDTDSDPQDDRQRINDNSNGKNDNSFDEGISGSTEVEVPNHQLYLVSSKGVEVKMNHVPRKGIAFQLWPSSRLLSTYMEMHVDELFGTHTSILELGSGIGLCGLVAAVLGFKQVVMTDLPEALPLIQQNIALNIFSDSSLVRSLPLTWGNEEELVAVLDHFPSPPLVVVADCVYWEPLFKPLYETILSLVQRGSQVLMCYEKRWKKGERFFKLCRRKLTVELLQEDRQLLPDENTGKPCRRILRIYSIRAKEEQH